MDILAFYKEMFNWTKINQYEASFPECTDSKSFLPPIVPQSVGWVWTWTPDPQMS